MLVGARHGGVSVGVVEKEFHLEVSKLSYCHFLKVNMHLFCQSTFAWSKENFIAFTCMYWNCVVKIVGYCNQWVGLGKFNVYNELLSGVSHLRVTPTVNVLPLSLYIQILCQCYHVWTDACNYVHFSSFV